MPDMYDYKVYKLTTEESIFLVIKKDNENSLANDQYFIINKSVTDRLNVLTEVSRDPTVKKIVTFDKPFFNSKIGTKIAIPQSINYDKDLLNKYVVAERSTGPFSDYVITHIINRYSENTSVYEVSPTPNNTPVNSTPNSPKNSPFTFLNSLS
jgi:hypothetical protein